MGPPPASNMKTSVVALITHRGGEGPTFSTPVTREGSQLGRDRQCACDLLRILSKFSAEMACKIRGIVDSYTP